jgi:hypothetical protein
MGSRSRLRPAFFAKFQGTLPLVTTQLAEPIAHAPQLILALPRYLETTELVLDELRHLLNLCGLASWVLLVMAYQLVNDDY